MNFRLVITEILLRDVRKARSHALAVQVSRFCHWRVFRDTERQLASADTQLQTRDDVGSRLGDQVAAADAHVDGPFGAKDGDIVGAEESDVYRHFADAGEETSLLTPEGEPGLLEQLAGQVA